MKSGESGSAGEGRGRTRGPTGTGPENSGNESGSSKGEMRSRGQNNRWSGNRWRVRHRRREGRGRGSESQFNPEEIRRAVEEIDHEKLMRAEACKEEAKIEKETRDRVVAEDDDLC